MLFLLQALPLAKMRLLSIKKEQQLLLKLRQVMIAAAILMCAALFAYVIAAQVAACIMRFRK